MAKRPTPDGEAVRRLRNEAWLDRKDLAKIAGVSEHTIMRIELGHTEQPYRSTLKKIAKALNVHPSELVLKDGQEPEEPEGGSGPLGHVNRLSWFRMALAG